MDGLVQERRNSSALALELRLSCTYSSKWWPNDADVNLFRVYKWEPNLVITVPADSPTTKDATRLLADTELATTLVINVFILVWKELSLVNTMAADDLANHEAKASTAMLLNTDYSSFSTKTVLKPEYSMLVHWGRVMHICKLGHHCFT